MKTLTFTFETGEQYEKFVAYITLGYFADDYYSSLRKSYKDSPEIVERIKFTNCYPVQKDRHGNIPWRQD